MCVAIYRPMGVHIPRRRLKSCWNGNPHGAGFMYTDGQKLNICKGYMTFKKFYHAYRAAVIANPKVDFVIHFRYATHGSRGAEMTHPFRISRYTGFVHNGILTDMKPGKNDRLSDTALYCERVLKRYPIGFISDPKFQRIIDAYACQHCSKFVFLDRNGQYYIANEKAGEWFEGAWYSNPWVAVDHKWDDAWDRQSWLDDLTLCDSGGRLEKLTRCDVCGGWHSWNEMSYDRMLLMWLCPTCCGSADREADLGFRRTA